VLAAAIAAAAASAADPVAIKVAADTAGSSTRVVVTFAKPMECITSETGGKLRIACPEPILADPASRTLDDAILSSWAADGDRALVLTLGAGYRRVDTFELANPTRLVLDLQGDRDKSAARGAAPPVTALPVIVLDPGHGGVETGAVGPSGLEEKDVTLDLARRLKPLLERHGVTVVLTRDEDRVMPLDDRTAIANQNRAELFVSIHVNASKRKSAVGAETYFLSTDATDAEARTLAALENKAYAPAEPASGGSTPASGGPDRGLELILWDLAQNSYLAESSRLAELVQREMNTLAGTKDRGVRQAPFRVLMGATMPAILVEAAFISNSSEESRLADAAAKDKIAEAIARAIVEYRTH
jgi:N-acetylmuramoyl-L-alanine amidase